LPPKIREPSSRSLNRWLPAIKAALSVTESERVTKNHRRIGSELMSLSKKMASTESPQQKRMHITLSTDKHNQLNQLAEQYHNANTSACVRAAIEAYRLHLDGHSVEAIEKLRLSVDDLHDEIDELQEQIADSANNGVNPQLNQNSPTPENPETGSREISEGLRSDIHKHLLQTDGCEASVAEISEAVDAESLEVGHAVRTLAKNNSFVTSFEDSGTKKFRLE